MKKRLPVMLLSCVIVCSSGYAKTIGFFCIYNSDAPQGTADLITALETELFELCFDHGVITTSVEHIKGTSDRYADTAAVVKLFDSSLDYIAVLYCEYTPDSGQKPVGQRQTIEWKQLRWKIVDFSSQAVLFEELLEPEKIPDAELKQKIRSAGSHIGSTILNKL